MNIIIEKVFAESYGKCNSRERREIWRRKEGDGATKGMLRLWEGNAKEVERTS